MAFRYDWSMSERFLHEGEVLLCSRRSSPAVLVVLLLRGCIETFFTGFILVLLVAGTSTLALSMTPPMWLYLVIIVLTLMLIAAQRVRMWSHAAFRITTERILLGDPFAFFHAPVHTIKWPQYQESEAGSRGALDLFFLARPLVIRHGTADAKLTFTFPSLRYAEDLKHYLDKVDAAVRKNDVSSLRPFVAKPRGKRDGGVQ